MRQFLNGTDQAFADLESRATDGCVRFPDQDMPSGASPRQATIGFEVDAQTGRATLLTEPGIFYSGNSTEISEWLSAGEKQFESFEGLKMWIRGHVRAHFDNSESVETRPLRIEVRGETIRDVILDTEQGRQLDDEELEGLLLAVLARRMSQDPPS